MNEEEREIVKKFERLYLKDFNNEKITNEDRLSYIECALITNLIEKLQKENEELKNKLSLKQFDINVVYNDYLEKLNEYKENSIPIPKVKDKIEEILNNKEYRIVFEGNAEFPDDATIINAQKYIKLERMQELTEESEEK